MEQQANHSSRSQPSPSFLCVLCDSVVNSSSGHDHLLFRVFAALLLMMLWSNLTMAQVPPQPGQVPGNPQAPQNPGGPPPGAPAPAVDPDAGVSPLPYLVAFGSTLIFLTIVCMPSRKL